MNTDLRSTPVIFGEVLIDEFPDGRTALGGAPFNVAWHLQALGAAPVLVSRVGIDEAGTEIRTRMQEWGMSRAGLQTDAEHATGAVRVSFDGGEPSYTIETGRAYDFIDVDELSIAGASMLYHGTLALRYPKSRHALVRLRRGLRCPVFIDVNLRKPWWTPELVHDVMVGAETVKLSEGELAEVVGDATEDVVARARHLRERYGLARVVVTRGDAGATAVGPETVVAVEPEASVDVVDTVGAGDAFAAVLILGQLRDWSPEVTMRRAQELSSRVVGNRGAVFANRSPYESLMRSWGL